MAGFLGWAKNIGLGILDTSKDFGKVDYRDMMRRCACPRSSRCRCAGP